MDTKDLIKLENVGYYYDSNEEKKWIFENINLDIQTGNVIHIKGRNGSGKSTLLKVITGELELKKGKIYSSQRNIYSVYLNQNASDFTAENLTLLDQLYTSSNLKCREEFLAFIISALKEYEIGLENRLHEFIGHLSGGQRQIIALLSVLLSGADLICLDEFTSAMDPISVDRSTKLIKSVFQKTEISILFVSHDNWIPITTQEISL